MSAERHSKRDASRFTEQDLHIGLLTHQWIAQPDGVTVGLITASLIKNIPCKASSTVSAVALKATVHRSTRSVPMRKKRVSVTQIQCPDASAICIGRVSCFRHPDVKAGTHRTSDNGAGQSESICVYGRMLLLQLSLGIWYKLIFDCTRWLAVWLGRDPRESNQEDREANNLQVVSQH